MTIKQWGDAVLRYFGSYTVKRSVGIEVQRYLEMRNFPSDYLQQLYDHLSSTLGARFGPPDLAEIKKACDFLGKPVRPQRPVPGQQLLEDGVENRKEDVAAEFAKLRSKLHMGQWKDGDENRKAGEPAREENPF